MSSIRGLYGITIDADSNIFENVEAALAGGASVIQFRDKSSTTEQKYAIALKLKSICAGRATFIINDDAELAKNVDADGVHLGSEDGSIEHARKIIGEKTIGVSCYDQFSLAQQAQENGADYVAFGRFFSSSTKPDAVHASPDLITYAKQNLNIPVVAIGGITVNNADTLINAGADAIAVINGLFKPPDISETAKIFNQLLKNKQ